MDNEVVSNTARTSTISASAPSNMYTAELAAIMAEFKKVENDFGVELTARLNTSAENALLDRAVEGTVFASPSGETGGVLSLLDIADGKGPNGQEGILEAFWPIVNALKNRAQNIIAQIVALVRKAAKYAPCIPLVAKAVAAFKAQQYGTALKEALAAFSCIQSKA